MGLQTSCNLPSIPARVAEQLHILDALRRIAMHYVFRRSKEIDSRRAVNYYSGNSLFKCHQHIR